MKKHILFALCAAVLSGFSATLLTVNDPVPGKMTTINERSSGKLASIDVFSANESGTFQLARIFSTDIFTNAYDIAHTVDTNVTATPVYGDGYWVRESDGACFTNTISLRTAGGSGPYNMEYWTDGSVTNFIYYPNGGGHGYTYAHYSKIESGCDGDQLDLNGEPSMVTGYNVTNFSVTVSNELFRFFKKWPITGYNYATNFVHHYVTNSFWPVYKNTLVVTNDIFNAACSNHCYHGKPDPDVYFFKGDKIIFKGTATGGSHRFVIE